MAAFYEQLQANHYKIKLHPLSPSHAKFWRIKDDQPQLLNGSG